MVDKTQKSYNFNLDIDGSSSANDKTLFEGTNQNTSNKKNDKKTNQSLFDEMFGSNSKNSKTHELLSKDADLTSINPLS